MNSPAAAQLSTHRIVRLALNEPRVVRRKAEIEQERAVALGDLQRENMFLVKGMEAGPYHATISVSDNRMVFDITTAAGEALDPFKLPVLPFRSLMKDYFMICESYFEAISVADPYRLEAIDMARRGLHNEGSELLQRLMADRVEVDFPTARRLFTLMCVLHIR